MDEKGFQVRFWGTRGSVAVSGPQYERFGGNTACVEMRCGTHTLIVDAGSGIRPAGAALIAAGVTDMDLLFTHCHYDHIVGLPFFTPLYDPNVRVVTWSGHLAGHMTTEEMLHGFMRPPWFPVKFDICRASLLTRDFVAGDILEPRPGISIRTASLMHPGGCIGYRVDFAGRSVAVVTDTEHVPGELDAEILSLIADADLVIYDCTYTEDEMARFKGWGHSSWQQGIKLCQAAGARRLALFHHDPARTDTALDQIEAEARREFEGAFAAYDGLTVEV